MTPHHKQFAVKGVFARSVEPPTVYSVENPVEKLLEDLQTANKNLNNLLLLNSVLSKSKDLELDYVDNSDKYKQMLEELRVLQLKAQAPDAVVPPLVEKLTILNNQLNLEMTTFNTIFPQLVYSSMNLRSFIESIVSKIGHQEYKKDAEIYLKNLISMEQYLKIEDLEHDDSEDGTSSLNIEQAIRTIVLLNSISKQKQRVLDLAKLDEDKTTQTTRFVIWAMRGSVIFMVLVAVLYNIVWIYFKTDIFEILMLGIPLSVVVWGLVGSFASMLYRFNRLATHEFGDVIKWVETRPVQGVILACAFYLVLMSGEFLFTGGASTTSRTAQSGVLHSENFILLMSFLIGFSDKLADSVFNALIDKYSNIIPTKNNEPAKPATPEPTESAAEISPVSPVAKPKPQPVQQETQPVVQQTAQPMIQQVTEQTFVEQSYMQAPPTEQISQQFINPDFVQNDASNDAGIQPNG